ncbi:MAG TPA: hypothetical protein VMF08_19405 [Candidatus Sulfotelmatobacter sp.]|nr:hypothetical protein [Candidatus Sulfotelmatobacter sp.]
MSNTPESIDFFNNLKKSLSLKRFSGYHVSGSELDAFAKYQMRLLIKFICTSTSVTAEHIDRFPAVHSKGMGECQKIASKILTSVQKLPVPTVQPNSAGVQK